MLHEWLTRPHVSEWWGDAESEDELLEEYVAPTDPESSVKAYFAMMDGTPVGYIQSYVAMGSGGGWWTDETDPGVRGIDQFLANADQLGQGLGTAMIRPSSASCSRIPR